MDLYIANSQIDGDKHRENLFLLQAARQSDTTEQFFAAVGNIVERGDVAIGVAPTPNSSQTWIIKDLTKLEICIIFAGTEGTTNMQALVQGWLLPTERTDMGCQPWENAAAVILPNCFNTGHSNWRKITCIGYSYGGATAMQVGLRMRTLYPDADTQIWTYGAPKHTQGDFASLWRGMYIVRVFTQLDPVPNIPPGLVQGALLYAVNQQLPKVIGGLFIQSTSGYEIAPSGQLTPMASSAAPIIARPIALPDWLLGTNCFGADPHSLTTYAQYVAGTPSVAVPRAVPFAGPDNSPRVARPSAAEERRLFLQVLGNEGQRVLADPLAAVREAEAQTVRVPGEKYHRMTVLGVRMVAYQGVPMVICSTKREQKRVLSRLNRDLRFGRPTP